MSCGALGNKDPDDFSKPNYEVVTIKPSKGTITQLQPMQAQGGSGRRTGS